MVAMKPRTELAFLNLIDLLAMAIPMASCVREDFELISSGVRTLVGEGRDPTDEEWSVLNKRITISSARLQRAHDALERT